MCMPRGWAGKPPGTHGKPGESAGSDAVKPTPAPEDIMRPHLLLPPRLLAITLVCAGLAGCARGDARFPSLAPRPIEAVAIGEPAPESPAEAATPGLADAALDAAAARTLASAEAAIAPFDSQRARARAAVSAAQGAAPASERWIVAQQAISRLVELRGPVETALATLDQARIDAAQRQPAVDTRRLEAARERVSTIQRQQADACTALADALTPA
jgi:hypothetical protein